MSEPGDEPASGAPAHSDDALREPGDPSTEDDGEARPDEDSGFDRRTLAKSVAGFAVAALLLYLFGRVLGWQRILDTLVRADPRWVLAGCLSTTACLVVWAKGWDIVLGTVDVDIPMRELVPMYYAATFTDYVTPFGRAGGGPLIAYVLSTDRRASYEESLAGVVTASGMNLLPFFSFAGLGILALTVGGDVPSSVRPVLLGLGGMAVGLPLLGLVLWHYEETVVQYGSHLAAVLSSRLSVVDARNVEERLVRFFSLLDRVGQSRARLAEVLALAYAGWALFAAPMWFAAVAVGHPVDPLLVAFVVPASTMASFVPTPGGLGGVEAAVVALLVGLGGVPPPAAAAIALLYRVASYWYVVLVGGGAAFWVLYRR